MQAADGGVAVNRRFDYWNYPREHERDLSERGYRPYEPYRDNAPGHRRHYESSPGDYRYGARDYGWNEGPYRGALGYGDDRAWQSSSSGLTWESRALGAGRAIGYPGSGERIPAWNEHPWNPASRSHGQSFLGRILGRGRGPKGYKRSDERIREDIHEQLINEPYIDASDVTIEVKDGEAILDGTVPERRMKYAIEDVVVNCHGVREVHNRIRVPRPSGDYVPDKPRQFGGYGMH
jgi:osmotically-inducible protein OsmY